MTSAELIAEVRALDKAATAGPWLIDAAEICRKGELAGQPITERLGKPFDNPHWSDGVVEANGNLIARYRSLAPLLAERLEAAEKLLDTLAGFFLRKPTTEELKVAKEWLERTAPGKALIAEAAAFLAEHTPPVSGAAGTETPS